MTDSEREQRREAAETAREQEHREALLSWINAGCPGL